MAHQDISYAITNGPSKFDLMVALFKKGEEVRFTINTPKGVGVIKGAEFVFMINGVAIEDGSRDSWLINGFYTENSKPLYGKVHWQKFEGYYDTRNRTGWLKNLTPDGK